MIKPALEGTKNVLSSVLKSKDTIKRVIVTSSFAGAIVAPVQQRQLRKVLWLDSAVAPANLSDKPMPGNFIGFDTRTYT